MFKVIASDLDDTLLNGASELTPRTIRAIRHAMDRGAKFVIASGRMAESTLPFAKAIGVNAPAVIYNGGAVWDPRDGRILSAHTIPAGRAREICRKAEDLGLYIQAFPGKGYFYEAYTPYSALYETAIRVRGQAVGKPLSGWLTEGVLKLLIIGEKEETQHNIDLLSQTFPDVSFMMSRPNYIEIVSRGVDKACALRETLRLLGVSEAECIAFGDAQNDLSMLKEAGRGYCVRNASEGVRAQCSWHCASNREDGPAQIIEQLLAEGLLGGGDAVGTGN